MRRQSLRYWGVGAVFGLAAAGAFVGRAQDQACAPAPAGMTGWWPGNGVVNELVYKTNAVMDNTITFGAGEVGQAFNFQGNHNGVKLPIADRPVGATGFTVEAWLNPADVAPGHPIFEWNNGTTFGVHMWTYEQNGELWANLMDTGGIAHYIKSPAGVLATNTFQHVALTYDRASGVGRIYRNGEIVANQNLGQFRPQTGGFDLYLGYRPAGLGQGQRYVGLMDEISVYRRALTPAEIQGIFRAGAAGKCTTPTGGVATATAPATGTQPATAAGLPVGSAPPGSPRITTGTAATATPTPMPTPRPILPTPTPIPLMQRPVANGPIAVFDFSVASGLDPALGHQISDTLATTLQRANFDIRTRKQVAQAIGTDTAAQALLRPPYRAATQNRLAAAVGAGSVLLGRVTDVQLHHGKSATVQAEVQQLQAGTGAVMDTFYITETTPDRAGTATDNQLLSAAVQRVVASTLRALRQAH
ncbi:MAG: LamG domain-containing protein [Abitibacteriaceae bacterium]|nr:LamG domain-containing protein [Abditibacteriaceae bacterium]